LRSGLACAVLLAAGPAAASPLFELTGAVQGDGGLAARALPAGAASAYFNPAFLPDGEEGVELGVFVLTDQIGIRLRARDGAADIPVGSVDMQRPGGGRYPRQGFPTRWLQEGKPAEPPDAPLRPRPRQGDGSGHHLRAYQVLGVLYKFLDQRAAAGLYALIPYGGFTGAGAFYSDEREQYFSNSLHPELYADRMTATSLSFALGGRLHRRLSLGVALTLGLRAVASTPTYLSDVGHFDEIMVDSEVQVLTSLAPHFGAVFTAWPGTRLSATVHTPQRFEVSTDFSFLLANGIEQRAAVRFTHDYLPLTFGLGAAQDLGGLTLVASALHARWSTYVDRHDERADPAYRWYDTLSGQLGARYRWTAVRSFLDLGYAPSPVPDQTGRTNYVDNPRVSASGGLEWRSTSGRWRAALQAQVHRLLPRETTKLAPPAAPDGVNRAPHLVTDEVPDDAVVGAQPLAGREGLQTNNPGWPGFSSEGWVFGAGLTLTLSY
jgi:long-chain fatty acid transport protein